MYPYLYSLFKPDLQRMKDSDLNFNMKESPNALMKYENQEKPIISELNNLNISKLQKMEPNNGFNNYTNNS